MYHWIDLNTALNGMEMAVDIGRYERLAKATAKLRALEEREALEASLSTYTRAAWPQIERKGYLHNWHIDAIAEHLEAVTARQITRLIINVPFRTMKSTLTNVMWPTWTWANNPGHQFLCGSHAEKLAARDNLKHRRLVQSPWYRARWGDVFDLTGDQNQKMRFENSEGGYRIGFGMTSGITGDGGDTIIIDDPHDRDKAQSKAERETALETFDQSIITRLNDPDTSAIVIIMQRLHERDLSGHLFDGDEHWETLVLPMEFEPARRCVTSIGFIDPREAAGDLLWPERFSIATVAALKTRLGSYGASGQLQQSPSPAGGGILKRAWWKLWDREEALSQGLNLPPEPAPLPFPPFAYIIASLDTAYTEKQENDPSACTVWGVWRDRYDVARVMLVNAWSERLELTPLVDRVAATCRKFRVSRILIEAKSTGISVAQELQRRYLTVGHGLALNPKTADRGEYAVQLVNPGRADKVARAYAVTPMLEAGLVYAPDTTWAESVIVECEQFPKSAHDDLVDTTTQGLAHLRLAGVVSLPDERQVAEDEALQYQPQLAPLYPV